MAVTVADVMRRVRNCFPSVRMDGTFTICNHHLDADGLLLPGDWLAIVGSARADGVWQLDENGCLNGPADEIFTGSVWLLRPPEAFLRLCADIIAYDSGQRRDGLRRERFGAYSLERAVDGNGLPIGWETVFRHRLLPWQRMYWKEGVMC